MNKTPLKKKKLSDDGKYSTAMRVLTLIGQGRYEEAHNLRVKMYTKKLLKHTSLDDLAIITRDECARINERIDILESKIEQKLNEMNKKLDILITEKKSKK